jgi:hypothetical protein
MLLILAVKIALSAKKPSRNDDNLRRFNLLNSPVIYIDLYNKLFLSITTINFKKLKVQTLVIYYSNLLVQLRLKCQFVFLSLLLTFLLTARSWS